MTVSLPWEPRRAAAQREGGGGGGGGGVAALLADLPPRAHSQRIGSLAALDDLATADGPAPKVGGVPGAAARGQRGSARARLSAALRCVLRCAAPRRAASVLQCALLPGSTEA